MREAVVFLGMIKRSGGALKMGFVMDDNWLIIAIGIFFVFVTAEVFQLGKFHVLPTAEGKNLRHIKIIFTLQQRKWLASNPNKMALK